MGGVEVADLITLPRAVVQQALAFTMRNFATVRDFEAARAVLHDTLRAALEQPEQPEQEPVVWECKAGGLKPLSQRLYDLQPENIKRHYTRIARREWRGLTEEEIQSVIQLEREKRFQRRPPLPLSMTELSHAIEAALKEKNHE